MSHFEREAKLQLWLVAGPLLFTAAAGFVAFACRDAIDAARVDSCLDAGGSYDYAAGRCDFDDSHAAP